MTEPETQASTLAKMREGTEYIDDRFKNDETAAKTFSLVIVLFAFMGTH